MRLKKRNLNSPSDLSSYQILEMSHDGETSGTVTIQMYVVSRCENFKTLSASDIDTLVDRDVSFGQYSIREYVRSRLDGEFVISVTELKMPGEDEARHMIYGANTHCSDADLPFVTCKMFSVKFAKH